MKLFATDVFTPNQFPEYTYIERPKEDLERCAFAFFLCLAIADFRLYNFSAKFATG